MGITKTEGFTEKQNSLALQLKALGHPARLAIVDYLLQVESCICGDIVDELPLAQPTISQHLKELKTAGLIKGTIEGKAICYCVDQLAIERLQDYFTKMADKLKSKNKNCC